MGLLKKAVILVTIFTISILIVACTESSIESNVDLVDSVKQKAVTYLTAKGYKEEEYKLDVFYRKNHSYGGPYAISVIFDDEPNVIYYYEYVYNANSKLKEITQGSIAPIKDKKDKNFKHAEN